MLLVVTADELDDSIELIFLYMCINIEGED